MKLSDMKTIKYNQHPIRRVFHNGGLVWQGVQEINLSQGFNRSDSSISELEGAFTSGSSLSITPDFIISASIYLNIGGTIQSKAISGKLNLVGDNLLQFNVQSATGDFILLENGIQEVSEYIGYNDEHYGHAYLAFSASIRVKCVNKDPDRRYIHTRHSYEYEDTEYLWSASSNPIPPEDTYESVHISGPHDITHLAISASYFADEAYGSGSTPYYGGGSIVTAPVLVYQWVNGIYCAVGVEPVLRVQANPAISPPIELILGGA